MWLPLRIAIVVLDPNSDEELNEQDSWTIGWSGVKDVIVETGGRCPLNPEAILKAADERAAVHFRRQEAKYVLVTGVSIAEFPRKKICIRGCVVSGLQSRGHRYRYPEDVKGRLGKSPIVTHVAETEYKVVKVTTTGRTGHEAVERALGALHLLRGLWTLFGPYSWFTRSFTASAPRQGRFHAAPIHTLHHPGGQLVAESSLWHEPDYVKDQAVFKPKGGWAKIEQERKNATRKLMVLPYGRELADLIVRYALALDQPNLNVAFLQMWNILEWVTGTIGGPQDKTVKRATWFHLPRGIEMEVLQSLRVRRNRFVHSGTGTDEERDQIVTSIKRYVDSHLLNLIVNVGNVSSIEEYATWLDQPTSIDTLKQQRRRVNRAIRLLERA